MKQTRHKIEGGEIFVWHPTLDSPGYAISLCGGGWMPGIYESEESAVRGAECCFIDESRFVEEIQQLVNFHDKGNRLITLLDMANFK